MVGSVIQAQLGKSQKLLPYVSLLHLARIQLLPFKKVLILLLLPLAFARQVKLFSGVVVEILLEEVIISEAYP